MTGRGLTQPLTLCLLSLALSSCASSDPVSIPSYSETLRAETARQKAADCGQLKPLILPDSVQDVLPGVEAKLTVDGLSRTEALRLLSPEERALLDWFNQDVAEAENHQTYCNTGATL
jgi:hypothetical protein